MRKFFFSVFIISSLFISQKISAQTKIGYFNPEEMASYMPEKPGLDTLLSKFQRDSLITTYTTLLKEYQYKDSMLTKTDTTKMPKSVLAEYQNSVNTLGYELRNWQSISNQVVQGKAQRLYAPMYAKIEKAMNDVAKEKGYKYVLVKDVFLIAGPGDDLLPLVAAKLGVKLPADATGQK
jgi:outer membrane protein